MHEIILHARTWTTEEDFYVAYLPAVGAPDWHGHNLNAILDSLRGDINAIDPPFRIRIIGADHWSDFLGALARVVSQARSEDIPVELVLE